MTRGVKFKKCSIEGCGRYHVAHGYCSMHYKRWKKHGTLDYTWGGKVPGRACMYCSRPVMAREMCNRHYNTWKKYGDPYFLTTKNVATSPQEHILIIMVTEWLVQKNLNQLNSPPQK